MALLDATGRPILPSQEELNTRRKYVDELMNNIQAQFAAPINTADYLTVGINMMQAFIFTGAPEAMESRMQMAMKALDGAVRNSLENMALNAKVTAGLKADEVIH